MAAHQRSRVPAMSASVHAAAGSSNVESLTSSQRTRRYFAASSSLPSSANASPVLVWRKTIEVQQFANLLTVDHCTQRTRLQHACRAVQAVQTLLQNDTTSVSMKLHT